MLDEEYDPPRPPPLTLEVGSRLGRYTIEAVLGAGGMGRVYRAEDSTLHRKVALKVLHADPDADESSFRDAAARMLREARAVAALDHPNVVAIFELGEVEQTPFIAMEYVVGTPLRDFIGRSEVPISERLRWLKEIARALGAAHDAGIVHRDVKPENIIVRKDGVVKVLDFGIARGVRGGGRALDVEAPGASLPTVTREGMMVGTLCYMAPEQLRAEPLDGRADQFAWGVVAYELLAGKLPWQSDVSIGIITAIMTAEPTPLERLCPGLSPALAVVVARAMMKSPRARFSSMAELVDALERFEAAAPLEGALAATIESPKTLPDGGALVPRASATSRTPRASSAWLLGGVAVLGLLSGVGWAAWTLHNAGSSAPPVASVSPQAPSVRASQAALASLAPAASGSGAPTEAEPPIRVTGTSIVDAAFQSWTDSFRERFPHRSVVLKNMGSGPALATLLDRSADMAITSRPANAEEIARGLAEGFDLASPASRYYFALDALAVVVHPDNATSQLTMSELRDLFTGKAQEWQAFRQGRGAIELILRPEEFGEHQSFTELVFRPGDRYPGAEVLRTGREVQSRIARSVHSVSYVSYSLVGSNKVLRVGHGAGGPFIAPSTTSIRDRSYPLTRPLYLYTRGAPRGALAEFIAHIRKHAETVLASVGLVAASVQFIEDPSAAGRVAAACPEALGARRVASVDVVFRGADVKLPELGQADLDQVAASLCATSGAATVDLVESGGPVPKAARVERARWVFQELQKRCGSVALGCVREDAATPERADGQGRRVRIWARGVNFGPGAAPKGP